MYFPVRHLSRCVLVTRGTIGSLNLATYIVTAPAPSYDFPSLHEGQRGLYVRQPPEMRRPQMPE